MMEILPTNTCPPDLAELRRRTGSFAGIAPSIQLDVCDGVFAPALSWPYGSGQWEELGQLAGSAEGLPLSDTLTYEAHLMVQKPVEIGELLARAGCARILAHVEVFTEASVAEAAFRTWKKAGASETGLAVLMQTPLSALAPFAPLCDVVQFMSIGTVGYQGAQFEPGVLDRIGELHEKYPGVVIEVDGGVSRANIADLARAGATRFGVGSAISKAESPKAAYGELKALAESAVH